jgi:hypothetical protein
MRAGECEMAENTKIEWVLVPKNAWKTVRGRMKHIGF